MQNSCRGCSRRPAGPSSMSQASKTSHSHPQSHPQTASSAVVLEAGCSAGQLHVPPHCREGSHPVLFFQQASSAALLAAGCNAGRLLQAASMSSFFEGALQGLFKSSLDQPCSQTCRDAAQPAQLTLRLLQAAMQGGCRGCCRPPTCSPSSRRPVRTASLPGATAASPLPCAASTPTT